MTRGGEWWKKIKTQKIIAYYAKQEKIGENKSK